MRERHLPARISAIHDSSFHTVNPSKSSHVAGRVSACGFWGCLISAGPTDCCEVFKSEANLRMTFVNHFTVMITHCTLSTTLPSLPVLLLSSLAWLRSPLARAARSMRKNPLVIAQPLKPRGKVHLRSLIHEQHPRAMLR